MSRLIVSAITRAARSAGVSLLMLTQYGLMDALGTQGNMTKRNITLRVAARPTPTTTAARRWSGWIGCAPPDCATTPC